MRRLLAAILATCVAACIPVDDEVASIDGAGVTTTRHHLTVDGRRVLVQLHRPPGAAADVPTVIFLPGYLASADQYDSYARALAESGVAVAVRGRYGPFLEERELAGDAGAIADWLVSQGIADASRLGVAGHSTGGKTAIWAAALDSRFRAVVALDPDDQGKTSVIHGPLGDVEAPLLLVGAEVGWKGADICAPLDFNYQRFFDASPEGTVMVTLHDADHVQLMDDPDALGMGLCRVGGADSAEVLEVANTATAAFFREHLLGEAEAAPADYGEVASVAVREPRA